MRARVSEIFFPDPLRRIPAHRALGVALRTAHLLTFGTVVGGHVLGVEPPRLGPFLLATVATGIALVALELASTCAWLFTGKGVAVLLKLLLLLAVPLFWERRVPLLIAVVVVASVGAHMSSRFRHYHFAASFGPSRPAAAPGRHDNPPPEVLRAYPR